MEKNVAVRAGTLPPEQRIATELLPGPSKGRVLKPAPAGQAREEAYRQFLARVDATAKRAEGIPESEIDAAIDEAIGAVRQNPG